MTNKVSIKKELEKSFSRNTKYITLPFYFEGRPLESSESEKHARWGMTLLSAGTMRFRWNETNENRDKTIKEILAEIKKPVCSGNCSSLQGVCDCKLKSVPIELIHSKTTVETKNEGDTKGLQADGIVTKNPLLVPTVTVADCVPIFLYDKETKAIGAFHSGWKGTGIIQNALNLAAAKFGTKMEDVCVAIGPHINDCCYVVDEQRADYFCKNFSSECVESVNKTELSECAVPDWNTDGKKLFRLSLTKANLSVLEKIGVKRENIIVCTDCTCCTTFVSPFSTFSDIKENSYVYGSFRRQTSNLPKGLPAEELSKRFTVQAAFCGFVS